MNKKFTKPEKSWIMYDWANSVYATNMLAALFPIYFGFVYSNAHPGSDGNVVLISLGASIATLVTAILAPFLGALGDHKGFKKRLFATFLFLGVSFTIFCAITSNYMGLLVGYVVSHIGFSGANIFYDSFLTDVTTKERMNKVSAWGFAMGYLGGSTIPFLISIVLYMIIPSVDLSMKIIFVLTGLWWLVFAIPILKNVRQVHYIEKPSSQLIKSTFKNLFTTFKSIIKVKKILFFVLAYFFYIDAVNTVITISTAYGTTLRLDSTGMILALLVTQIVGIPCAIIFSKLADKLGSIKMIVFAVIMYTLICFLGFFMGYNVEVNNFSQESIDFSLVLFWLLAFMVGTVQGGIQAISRAHFGKLIPPEKSNEYFGFFDIFGKFAAVLGPLLIAGFTIITGSEAIGILSLVFLLLMGLILLFIGRKHFKDDSPSA